MYPYISLQFLTWRWCLRYNPAEGLRDLIVHVVYVLEYRSKKQPDRNRLEISRPSMNGLSMLYMLSMAR